MRYCFEDGGLYYSDVWPEQEEAEEPTEEEELLQERARMIDEGCPDGSR